MYSLISHKWLRLISSTILVFLSFSLTFAQDPDPNSPIPVLLSEPDSTRALTATGERPVRKLPSRSSATVFGADQKIKLFVTNIVLMDGEGANAFRVYMQDASGRQYRFPVLAIKPVDSQPDVFAITTVLTDDLRYWPTPDVNGDVLVRLTWRGLASNQVRLGWGSTGGTINDAANAVPTPYSIAKTIAKGGDQGPVNELVGYRWSGDRARFLEQATFGRTEALDHRLRRIGLRVWMTEQFELPYPSAQFPYPNIPLMSTNANAAPPAGCGAVNTPDPTTYQICIRDHYQMYPVQTWFYKEALYGDAQLRHRVAWALSQVWVISGVDTQQSSWMFAYHQQLSKNAFGNYRTLMYDITLNPGMGNYLDMLRSTRTNPNENYPREILQLFTIGLFMLNQDGTLQTDGQGNPIPTYDQTTVNNFTKVFTGWRDCRPADLNAQCPNATPNGPDYKDPMSLNPGQHDITAKTLLTYPGSAPTQNIAACTGCTNAQIFTYAYNSLNQALNNIYDHPNVAPFVSKLLIQHLVTSDPTPAYVGRISAVFNAHKQSQTQLKEVVRAILLDPEARGDVKTDPRYGKLREPVQLATGLYRNFNVTDAAGTGLSDGDINRFPANLGQNAFNSPTVFNYYSPDYVIPGTSLLAPEFNIYTTSTSIGRANVGSSIVYGQINVSMPNTPNGTRINLADLQAVVAADSTNNQLLDHLNTRMMHGAMSPQMRSTIMTAVNTVATADTLGRARMAVYLIATSSQYQVQR